MLFHQHYRNISHTDACLVNSSQVLIGHVKHAVAVTAGTPEISHQIVYETVHSYYNIKYPVHARVQLIRQQRDILAGVKDGTGCLGVSKEIEFSTW